MLCSAVMPTTWARRHWIPLALQCFQLQDYSMRELIVGSEDPEVRDLLPFNDTQVRFVDTPRGITLGEKHNRLADAARGSCIAHWDDDDWHAPWRLREQMRLHAASLRTSASRILDFVDVTTREVWTYTFSPGSRGAHGGTLCYPRALWQQYPFRSVQRASDYFFIDAIAAHQTIIEVESVICVASTHQTNTCTRVYQPPSWQRSHLARLPTECRDWLTQAFVDHTSDQV